MRFFKKEFFKEKKVEVDPREEQARCSQADCKTFYSGVYFGNEHERHLPSAYVMCMYLQRSHDNYVKGEPHAFV